MLNELIDGRYKVEREIGRGGMGVVLRAYDTRLNRVVALKMLPSNTTHDSELCHRLAAEARAASALSHPCIATVHDFVEQGERSFIVYEFVEGRTWRNELARTRFTTDEILDVSVQLADALVAAHGHGMTAELDDHAEKRAGKASTPRDGMVRLKPHPFPGEACEI